MATRTKASRSAAAKKAAATRKRNAAKRSAAAKKAAATRKRNGAKRTAAKRGTKASRSAAAKKAAATRKRNAAKRTAAAKKAAATRKRNARKSPAKRKASTSKRSTKASRSAAAKKAAATRKRNANKRSRAAKKAAATRKRNARGGRSTVKTRSRPTAGKRRAAAKKAAATRKRNAAKRSRAAKKAAATRKRNSGKRRGSRRSRAKTATKSRGTLYNAFMAPINDMPGAVIGLAYAAALGGAYAAIKPMVWGRMGLTGANGYISQAANMLPVLPETMKTDLANFGNKALDLGTIGAAAFLLSDKKRGLGLLSKGQRDGIVAVALTYYGMQFFGEVQTYNIGRGVRDLITGNGFSFGDTPDSSLVTYGTLGSTGMMYGNQNYSMGMSTMNNKMFGVHNGGNNMMLPAPAMNNGIVNTAATRGTAGNAIFGTRRGGLGSSRVNLF